MAKIKRTAQTIKYGWVIDPDTDAVIEDRKQQAVIDQIIRDHYVLGIGFKGIADTLNAEGIPTAKRGKWHPSTVSNIWNNDTNRRVDSVMKADEKARQEEAEAHAASPEGKAWAEMLRQQEPEY